jgi:hypothetical protein
MHCDGWMTRSKFGWHTAGGRLIDACFKCVASFVDELRIEF